MTATPDTTAARPSFADTLAVYLKPRVLIVLFLGFSAGLPLALSSSTLLVWMREVGVDLGVIGLFALVGTPYTIKFLWAPVVDALEGLELDSLRGSGRVIRKADHQANVGSYIGVVAWDRSFPDFALWRDATYIPGDRVWRPEDEVRRVRARAQTPPHVSEAP